MNTVIKTVALWVFYTSIVFFVFSLSGCAALEGLLTETQDIAATGGAQPQIEAITTLIGDIINQPYKVATVLVVGYISALLRRLYKKKKGAKTL